MPQLVTVRVHTGQGRRVRLYVPLVPVLLVLLPFLPLVLIGLIVAGLATRVNPFRALYVGWRLLWALGGTRIEIKQGQTAVLVKL